ncbi:MAG: FtsX-like permease family protein [Alphaproteobacteria bacterium]|nr:FtsX-like permease family protein [Alphaproteobacteria bacterium]
MALPNHIFAPAFRHRGLGWFLALLVGIMVYLASFAMAAEAGLSVMTFRWDRNMSSRLTVEIPPADDESSTPQSERVKQVLEKLRGMPDIKKVVPLPDSETAELLKPWIRQSDLLKSLPLPTLIDIELRGGASLDAADIHSKLRTAVKDVSVNDHAAWLDDLAHLARGIAAMAALTIFLTCTALVMTISLVCRAIMATERETISLLHTLGAEDDHIARHFQLHAGRQSIPASFAGFTLAVLSAGVLFFFLRNFADPLSLTTIHWIGLGLAVLAIPLGAIGIAALTARLSALQLLRSMP